MTQYRASFDASVAFSNGGDLAVRGFRVDVPGPDVTEADIGTLFVASLGLLMTQDVVLSNVEVFAEPHKGTRGGPSHHSTASHTTGGRFVELNHVIRAGTTTGTQLVAPSRRYAEGPNLADGPDLADMPSDRHSGRPEHAEGSVLADGLSGAGVLLTSTVDLPTVVVRVSDAAGRAVGVGAVAAVEVRGAAVLIHAGDSAAFGTPSYTRDPHYLTGTAADWLAAHGAVLVGIDAPSIDVQSADESSGESGGERSGRERLHAAGIPVVEHLTGLEQLPPTGARFTAVPLRIEGADTFPVRAFARLPDDRDGA